MRALDCFVGAGLTDSPYKELVNFVKELLDPEVYGHAVSKEVRNEARRVLGLKERE